MINKIKADKIIFWYRNGQQGSVFGNDNDLDTLLNIMKDDGKADIKGWLAYSREKLVASERIR